MGGEEPWEGAGSPSLAGAYIHDEPGEAQKIKTDSL